MKIVSVITTPAVIDMNAEGEPGHCTATPKVNQRLTALVRIT